MKQYVVGFLFNEDGTQVVLIRKTHPEWQAGRWNGVGGVIEPGESALACIRREFEEETGVLIEDWELFAVLHDASQQEFRVAFFCAHSHLCDQVRTMTDESVALCPLSNLLNVLPNLRWLIPMALSMPLDRAMCFDIGEIYEAGEDY